MASMTLAGNPPGSANPTLLSIFHHISTGMYSRDRASGKRMQEEVLDVPDRPDLLKQKMEHGVSDRVIGYSKKSVRHWEYRVGFGGGGNTRELVEREKGSMHSKAAFPAKEEFNALWTRW